ncbi:hypothetical protein BDY19DRAFT_993195 [Irpex rosettiformis]|uniref:Uncharacterized protein n=1 Tax=Irpex rosettiformis TaxID=378272 RepID=A0ACB8U5P5_9APHY|nr:hypothetical protein BDY19DRAFT_993195 [Irpex rosettiformis]
MTVGSAPSIPHYQPPPPTKQQLDYADLAIIDLAKAATPEGRAELAGLARDAMRDIGFFYIVNHGLSPHETERVFDIADVPFSHVSDKEKLAYTGNILETGTDQGYKPRQYWNIDGGVKDQVENYVINRDVTKRQHPEALRPFLPELSNFARKNHDILHTVLRLLAIGLEIPEDTFVNQHGWDADGETYVRFMKYYPRTAEEEEKSKQVWLKGHTDFGTITILWSQPVSALQILSPDGEWRWLRHIDNALVINAGDCMEFISGGFYKATIHRVIQPPEDQRGYTRLGVFYFCNPDNDVVLETVSGSSVLERLGIKRSFIDDDTPTAGTWLRGRIAAYGKTQLSQGQQKGVEEEVLNGAVVRHYN